MASGNPLQDQGVLNRIKANVTWRAFPSLNVTASFLDKDGISMRLDGDMSLQHGTMTGTTQSPEPYVGISVVIAMLRTQPLANAYKTAWENNVILGAGIVYPDVSTGLGLGAFQLNNMSIQNVADQPFNGQNPAMVVTCRGFYVINNALWN